MKQLKIELSLSEYNEKHFIYLGNNECLKHKSKSFLKIYLRTYKKVILDNVRLLNIYNAQIYTLYRSFYFDLSLVEIQHITDYFNMFNKQYNWMFDNIGGSQNVIVFSKINVCVNNCIDILQILKGHSQTNKNYSLKNQSESLLKVMNDFFKQFEKDKNSLSLNRDYTKDNLRLINKQLLKSS
jgi:hypothetical protein